MAISLREEASCPARLKGHVINRQAYYLELPGIGARSVAPPRVSAEIEIAQGVDALDAIASPWREMETACGVSSPFQSLALARAAELKRKERALHEMRRSLEHLAERCHGDDRPECPILGGLEGQPAALSQR